MAHWLVFDDDNGRGCLRGPYYSYARAQEKGDKLLREFKIVELPTSNSDKATRMIKERRIDSRGFDEGSKNMRHKNLASYEVL